MQTDFLLEHSQSHQSIISTKYCNSIDACSPYYERSRGRLLEGHADLSDRLLLTSQRSDRSVFLFSYLEVSQQRSIATPPHYSSPRIPLRTLNEKSHLIFLGVIALAFIE